MTDQVTYDLFIVSLVVLLLVLVVLLVLCWTLKLSRSSNFTQLQITAGQPVRILTIRTEPNQVHQLLDHLLDRVLLQVEPGAEPKEEHGEELREERGSDFVSEPEISAAESVPSRMNALNSNLWKWITFAAPPPASPPAAQDQDQTDDLRSQGSDASLASQSASCSACWEKEEQHDERVTVAPGYCYTDRDRETGFSSVLLFTEAGRTETVHGVYKDTYERTLTVDGEETTLIVMDTWENDKLEGEGSSSQDNCLKVGSAYVIVYSVTDRSSFDSAAELRITLRRTRQAENLPIILVGNKSDLVRSREVAVEEGRACAVVFDCKFIETSASLQHNVTELFEGVVRQLRLRRDGNEAVQHRRSIYKRKESITQKARRFLDRLVARNNQRMAVKVRSKSCHDLAVL
eukprot:superscaffoldBa00001803_g12086